MDCVDWSEALRSVKGDQSLLNVVLETFLEETPRLMERIRDAMGRGDSAALKIAAHSLKGSFRYLGIVWAFEQAFELEKMAQEGNLANAHEVYLALEGHVSRVMPALQEYLQRAKSDPGR